MSETPARPDSVPADAWWEPSDNEWVLGPKDDDGQLHGEVAYWRPDGTLCCRCNYEGGQAHGQSKRFHESGEVSQTCSFVRGTLHGRRTWFSIEGPTTENTRPSGVPEHVMRSEMDYEMGDVTAVRHFDAAGRRLCADGTPFPDRPSSLPESAWWDEREDRWKDGRANGDAEKIGAWKHWDREGLLLLRCVYEADALHGAAWERVEPETLRLPNIVAARGDYHEAVRVGPWEFLNAAEQVAGVFDYGAPVGAEEELVFLDNATRPAEAWLDLAGRYGAQRSLGLWLATLGRAAGVAHDVTQLRAALAARPSPWNSETAMGRAEEGDSVGDVLDALAAGADVAACLRGLAIQLDQHERSQAALEFIDAAMMLAPDRADYAFTRALVNMSLGHADAARSDAARIPDEGQRGFMQLYAKVLFPVFDFWPNHEDPQTHYDGLPDAPSRPLPEVLGLLEKYATRVDQIRTAMLEHEGVTEETPWLLPDVSVLLPCGPVSLGTDRLETPDPDDPDEPFVIEIDETLELGDAIPDLLRSARAEWHSLCWLLWSSGLDRVGRPTRMMPPKKFGQAAGMAPARLWRCRDRVHMRGMGAQTQGVPGFEWNGVDIDSLPGSLTNMAMFEYQEMQALMYWLTDPEVRSPWQDNLRGS
ncbi:MAG: hypothetical protein ACRBN8_29430 [Nannocystales bacterium]